MRGPPSRYSGSMGVTNSGNYEMEWGEWLQAVASSARWARCDRVSRSESGRKDSPRGGRVRYEGPPRFGPATWRAVERGLRSFRRSARIGGAVLGSDWSRPLLYPVCISC